jgi:3-oxoacyl-[acyl-carrier protein] reductase
VPAPWDIFKPEILTGRRALVTGGGQGVGAVIGRALASAGATVVINDVDPDRAGECASEIGHGAVGHAADVTDLAAVTAMAEQTGPWDIVVNNAGMAGASAQLALTAFADTDEASWAAPLAVNVNGVLNVTRAALPAVIANGWGRIVTIVSDAGRVGDGGLAVYAAAKAAAAGFMRSIARENGKFGITANCISLGTMQIPERDTRTPEQVAAQVRRYPLRRLGHPDDVAGLVVLLASSAGSWITGQTIPVNGGYSSAL